MTDLQGLIERLEKAEGPDQKLDRDLTRITHKRTKRFIGATCNCCHGGKHLDKVWVDRATNKWRTTAKYGLGLTASIDAAVAFAERVLPGCTFLIEKIDLERNPHFDVLGRRYIASSGIFGTRQVALHNHAPHAILLATLRALMGKEGEDA